MAFSGKGKRKSAGAATAANNNKAAEATRQMTESEKLLAASDDDDSDEGRPKQNNKNDKDTPAVEYEPLVRLKRTLKARIAELAKQNSEQTVKLVEAYLSDGDF